VEQHRSARDSSLVFLRKKNASGTFDDVTLDCKGTLTGWQPITGTAYEYLQLDIATNSTGIPPCDTGEHTASSTSAFGLNVWGWANNSSYAYPAGMSVKAVNTVIVPPTPN
jgi:hypothetical protein